MVRTAIAVALMAFAACAYSAEIRDCRVTCNAESGCPDGLSCSESEGWCRTGGAMPTCAAIRDAAVETPAEIDSPLVDAPPQFSSCNGLAATCGPSANDSCCATATTIPGGMFYRSYDLATDGMYSDMSYPATLSAFVLDKYEVTVGRFRRFVTAGRGTQASAPAMGAGARMLNGTADQGGWDASFDTILSTNTTALVAAVKCFPTDHRTWTDTPGGTENQPMNCITWYEAMAFCIWDGGYLPTEAEWNYAASGGSEQRAYPWSSPAGSTTIDCSYANYNIDSPAGMYCVNVATGATNRVGSESPKGDGKWGQSDLAGNVWEWVLDDAGLPLPPLCNDCASLTGGSGGGLRGGTFSGPDFWLRPGARLATAPTARFPAAGVRCARTL